MKRHKGQFQPGQSGNPGGRVAVVKEVRELARAYTEEAVNSLAEIMRSKKSPAQARVAACNALLDRGYGRPAPYDTETGEQLIVQILKLNA